MITVQQLIDRYRRITNRSYRQITTIRYEKYIETHCNVTNLVIEDGWIKFDKTSTTGKTSHMEIYGRIIEYVTNINVE